MDGISKAIDLTWLLKGREFVNDLPSATESDVMLFADDTKLWRLIRDDTDILALQNDINRIIQWCDKWSLKLNVKKHVYSSEECTPIVIPYVN